MQKKLFNIDKIGLDKETLRKISIILQGTSNGIGINSKLLNFSNTQEIDNFITLANRYFEGILQFVQTQEKIVPIIINLDAYESKRRAISNKTIALACIILLHEFEFLKGPTFDVLEQKLQSTSINANELRGILRELKRNRWIRETDKDSIKIYQPTAVLKACISTEMLKDIFEQIVHEDYNDIHFESFLPETYLQIRKKIKTKSRQMNLSNSIKNEEEGDNTNE